MKTVDEFGRFGTVTAREEPPPRQAMPAAGLAPTARPAVPDAPAPRASGWRAVLQLSLLRRSVILADVLGLPRSLRGWEE